MHGLDVRLCSFEGTHERQRHGHSHHSDDFDAAGIKRFKVGHPQQELEDYRYAVEESHPVLLDALQESHGIHLVKDDHGASLVNDLIAIDGA